MKSPKALRGAWARSSATRIAREAERSADAIDRKLTDDGVHTLFDASEIRINPALVPAEIATVMNNGAPPITELMA